MIRDEVFRRNVQSPPKRVAIVHDWLPLYGGAERVLEQMINVFPEAELFSMIDDIDEKARGFLRNKRVQTSIVQRLPGGRKRYRSYLPIMPMAVEQFVLRDFDLILSSSYAVAKGVLTGPQQLHICYCHSPIRYAWDMQTQYLESSGLNRGMKGWLTKALLHYIRQWDLRSASGVDHFIANSHFIRRRIQKIYRRDSEVIYPPVDVEKFSPGTEKEDFYLTASRLVQYKRVDLIVDAFAGMPDRRLKVIGDGPELKKLSAKAAPNIEFLGYQPHEAMLGMMQRAKAFVFAAEEDFGIIPVEAQACGTPVIAFGKGGVLESVVRGVTGEFFDEQTPGAIQSAVERFEIDSGNYDSQVIRRNAERFSVQLFQKRFRSFVESRWQEFQEGTSEQESFSAEGGEVETSEEAALV